jgi:CDP-glucose 4,6-dehydratase
MPTEPNAGTIDTAAWQGTSVFLTGHTGFKGAWLALWLEKLGARVFGYALPPATDPNLRSLAPAKLQQETLADLADFAALRDAMATAKPTVIFHLAAQALVRRSFAEPLESFATNVQGTAHVLEAARHTASVKAVIIITTDKVYEVDPANPHAFVERDALGGYDPYAASKACAELVTQSYRRSFFDAKSIPVATARAGNVIGGGDWAADRIVPDIVAATVRNEPVMLRYPQAVRPWQHVLEPLSGYLLLAQHMLANNTAIESLNFGPDPENFKTVAQLVEGFHATGAAPARWQAVQGEALHETAMLTLDSTRARTLLHWKPRLDFSTTLRWTADWYHAFAQHTNMHAYSRDQIEQYQHAMQETTPDMLQKERA